MDAYDKLTICWTGVVVTLTIYVLLLWFGAAGGFAAPSCGVLDTFTDHHEAFVVVWHSLISIAVAVSGTFVMKKHRTAIGLGVFVGSIFVTANGQLSCLVLLGGQISKKNLMEENCGKSNLGTTSDVLTLLMGIVLFVLECVFCYLLVLSKNMLLSNTPTDDAGGGLGNMLGLGGGGESSSGSFSNIGHDQEEALTSV